MKNEGIVLFKNLQQLTTAEIRVDRGVLGTRKSRGFFGWGCKKAVLGLSRCPGNTKKQRFFFGWGCKKAVFWQVVLASQRRKEIDILGRPFHLFWIKGYLSINKSHQKLHDAYLIFRCVLASL